MSDSGSACPQCGEPLLVYSAEAGRYLGCPECLWMGATDGGSMHWSSEDVLDQLPEDPIPDWLMGDLDFPPMG